MEINKLKYILSVHKLLYSNPKALHFIVNNYKSIQDILNDTETIKNKFNFKNPELLFEKLSTITIKKEIDYIHSNNILIITKNDDTYPTLLREIHNPPEILFLKGNVHLLNKFSIGMVGPRKPTEYGKKCAHYFSKELSKYAVIVSGLAEGIDSISHETAINNQGKTIAVIGTGLNQCYPAKNKLLLKKILETDNLIISEIPLFIEPKPFHFPLRNRIISGISKGILICEATKNSGSLITAKYATEQNREIFSVPGNIFSEFSEGPIKLIQDGAKCTHTINDILNEFNIKKRLYTENKKETVTIQKKENLSLNDEELVIYNFINNIPKTIDDLVSESKLPLPTILHSLTSLEINAHIKVLPGKKYVKI